MAKPLALNKFVSNPSIFCVVRFPVSKARDSVFAAKLAKRAAVFGQSEDDAGAFYVAAFKKTSKDANLCARVLEGILSLKGVVCFVSGVPEKINWRLINVIECYSKALALENPKAYCNVESENLFGKPYRGGYMDPHTHQHVDHVEQPEPVNATCPCRDIEHFLMLSRKVGHSPVDQIKAVAELKKQALCPLFNAEDFRELVKEPAKYW